MAWGSGVCGDGSILYVCAGGLVLEAVLVVGKGLAGLGELGEVVANYTGDGVFCTAMDEPR